MKNYLGFSTRLGVIILSLFTICLTSCSCGNPDNGKHVITPTVTSPTVKITNLTPSLNSLSVTIETTDGGAALTERKIAVTSGTFSKEVLINGATAEITGVPGSAKATVVVTVKNSTYTGSTSGEVVVLNQRMIDLNSNGGYWNWISSGHEKEDGVWQVHNLTANDKAENIYFGRDGKMSSSANPAHSIWGRGQYYTSDTDPAYLKFDTSPYTMQLTETSAKKTLKLTYKLPNGRLWEDILELIK